MASLVVGGSCNRCAHSRNLGGKHASGNRSPLLPLDGQLRFDHRVMDVDPHVLGFGTALEVDLDGGGISGRRRLTM